MIECYGDLWEYRPPEDYAHIARGVTTNTTLNSSGELVMGAGVALEAKQRFPELPTRMGESVRLHGATVILYPDIKVFPFPTKRDWKKPSDLGLIAQSAHQLSLIAREYSHWAFILPRPGIGMGKLSWKDVQPVLRKELGGHNNVYVITNR